jgi:hypothetical protein
MNRHKTVAFALGIVTLLAAAARMIAAAENPIELWAKAVGGRDKVGKITSIYREATIEVAGYVGTIKAWHATDGRYRKEEQVADYNTIEVFDGTDAMLQQAGAAPQKMTGTDLERARSTGFANSNAMFFAFFPERQHGTVKIEDSNAIVFRPEGGIDWRVVLDPQTGLPAVMTHQEGPRTVTVTFAGYETIDGIQFEKEIHRTNGNPQFDSVIRFTKTVINPQIDSSVFSIVH